MKQKTVKLILVGLATICIVYLAFAFGAWDFDPVNWDTFTRVMFLSCAATCAVFAIGSANEIIK